MKYYYFVFYIFHTEDGKEGSGNAEIALDHKIERYCDIIDMQNSVKNQLSNNDNVQIEGICINNYIFLQKNNE